MLCRFSLNEPPAYAVAGLIRAALKEQVALMPLNNNRIPVALSSSSHRSGLTDIGNSVDFVLVAIFPDDFAWKHDAVLSEVNLDLHIHFYAV